MPIEGQEVELRGILESIGNRFFRGGWGTGRLMADHGPVNITGTLEGHVAGTSVVVKGCYKDSKWGMQLACSSIIVDSVSGEMMVIRSWARKHCKDHEGEIIARSRMREISERWGFLCDEKAMILDGLDEDVAHVVALCANLYMRLIETKKGLMERGFTDSEAEGLVARYGTQVTQQVDEDPYGAVIDRVLSFNRVDTVVDGRVNRNDVRRLHASLVQALVGSQRNGHTAMYPKAVFEEAAEISGVYVDAVHRAGLPRAVVEVKGRLQLRNVAYQEQDIATWIVEAMKLEE